MSGTSSVVLIEPNDDLRAVYASALRDSGFIVVAVPDCAAADYVIAEITPQIVVVSFEPRTHDGCIAFCQRLKADPATRDIAILLTSDTITGDDLQRAIEMKVLGLTVGPHDEAKMTAAVRGMLAVIEGRAAMSRPPWDVPRST
jgi:DNA-binding response OmpR family regulator